MHKIIDTAPPELGDLLRETLERVEGAFWLSSADATELLYVSPSYESLWGRSRAMLFQKPLDWLEGVLPDDRAVAQAEWSKALGGGEGRAEVRVLRSDGEQAWVRQRFVPIQNRGAGVCIACVATDITERKQLEARLRAAELDNRAITELTADYAYKARLEPDGTAVVVTFTDGFSRVTGYTLEEMNRLGGWHILIHPDDLPGVLESNERYTGCERAEGEARIITKQGAIRRIRFSSQRFRSVEGGPLDYLVGAVQDITTRWQAENELRELSRRLLEVQEQERRHLARELHDEVAQHLTALSLNLEVAAGSNPVDARRGLDRARGLVRELATRVRDLSLQLRPTMLDDLGLVPALLWLFESYETGGRLHVHFEHHGLNRRLGPDVEAAAYRIVQEGITNVVRHAQVKRATIRAWLAAERLHLTVEDRGQGFDVESARRSCSSAGLSGMQERAALLGGELTIESIAGLGTRIAAVIPAPAKPGESP
jgi:PAS domain S-box-containing protein